MLTLGVDPGLTGAFALLDEVGTLIACDDLPVIRSGKLGWIDAPTLYSRLLELRAGHELRAMVERCHAMPRNGTVAAFSQGCTLGSLLACLQMLACRVELISPSVWKRHLGLSADKAASLDRARLLFPLASLARVKDHNRAEALLLAEVAQRRLHTQGG